MFNAGSTQYLAHQFQTLGNRRRGRFVPLHLERNIAFEVRLAEYLRDTAVVEVEGVPDPAAEIRFEMHDIGMRGDFFNLGIGVAGEISDIEIDAEPR